MMTNSTAEETLSKQKEAIVNLIKEIQNQNMNADGIEHKHDEKSVIISKLIAGLVENIDFRQKSVEVENKYHESLNLIMKLMGKDMHEQCHKGEQAVEGNKALNDLQQKNFNEKIQMYGKKSGILHIAALKQQVDSVYKFAEDLKGVLEWV
ncbi:hypothetical protein VNO78_27038 [Psophocarpus tetragonolobus]|uniref:Uncharacterized protein n=1 Tax=Psophocarpus tetragonolobus TaxID=3891 RepID=A0AAN9S1Q7_PSOTE